MCKHIQCIKDDRWQLKKSVQSIWFLGKENTLKIKSNSSYIFTQMTGTPYLNYKFEAISRGASLNSAYNQSNEKELHDNHMIITFLLLPPERAQHLQTRPALKRLFQCAVLLTPDFLLIHPSPAINDQYLY